MSLDFTGRLRAHSSCEFCQWRCGSRARRGRCCPPLSWCCPPAPSALCPGQQPAEIAHQLDSLGSVSMADTTELSSSSHPQLRGPACFSVLPHSLRQKALLLAWSVRDRAPEGSPNLPLSPPSDTTPTPGLLPAQSSAAPAPESSFQNINNRLGTCPLP